MKSEAFVIVAVIVDPVFKTSSDQGSTFLVYTINVTIKIYKE